MVDIVEAFTVGPDDVQFGAVTFSSTARIEFTLDEHANQASVVNDINSWVRISKYLNWNSPMVNVRYIQVNTLENNCMYVRCGVTFLK